MSKGLEFSKKTKERHQAIVAKYPEKGAALLPTLWLAQREFSAITPEVEEYVAGLLGLSLVRVHEALSFYTMYTPQPLGKYHIQLCTNISCSLLGAEELLAYLKKRLNIEVGETTPDKKFTLSTAECLGYCGTAPVMRLNETFYENLTENGIDQILRKLP